MKKHKWPELRPAVAVFLLLLTGIANTVISSSPIEAGCDCGNDGLVPASGKVGTAVIMTVSGSASQLQGNYKVLLGSTPGSNNTESVTLKEGAIPDGITSTTIIIAIPETPTGNYFITFLPESGSGPISYLFSVKPDLKADPLSIRQGETLTVRGTGFPAYDTITISLGSKTLSTNVATNNSGSFKGEFKIPEVPAGEHKLSARHETYSINITVEMEILPKEKTSDVIPAPSVDESPPDTSDAGVIINDKPVQNVRPTSRISKPTAISPTGNRIGLIGDQPVTFEWSGASAGNGITYTLEINDSPESFAPQPVFSISGLKEPFYTVNIMPGTYYWRVQSVDSAGNRSDWSYAQYAFYVSELSCFVNDFLDILMKTRLPLIIGIIICIFIIIRLLVLLLRHPERRHRSYY